MSTAKVECKSIGNAIKTVACNNETSHNHEKTSHSVTMNMKLCG